MSWYRYSAKPMQCRYWVNTDPIQGSTQQLYPERKIIKLSSWWSTDGAHELLVNTGGNYTRSIRTVYCRLACLYTRVLDGVHTIIQYTVYCRLACLHTRVLDGVWTCIQYTVHSHAFTHTCITWRLHYYTVYCRLACLYTHVLRGVYTILLSYKA